MRARGSKLAEPRAGGPASSVAGGASPARPTPGRRFRRRQRARRRLAWRRVAFVLAVVALVGGAVWMVFFSPVLAVAGVEVRGTEVLSDEQVADAADVPLGEPLATANLTSVQARVEALPPVAAAAVSRSWPDRLRVQVTEREAVAVVAWDGRWRALDREGVLFRSYPDRPEGLVEVTMRSSTPGEALAEAGAVVGALPADLHKRLASVAVTSIDDITLRLRNGASVTWGSADRSAEKVEVLRVLLEREASVYDVTAPGRPTLRP